MGAFAAGNKLLASELNALPQVVDSAATSGNSPTASTTNNVETIDTTLGTVQVVADGNTQYEIALENAFFSPNASSTTGDHYQLRIYDGGSSAPTTATPGTAVATTPYRVNGTGSGLAFQDGIAINNRITPSAGTHIYAVSMTKDTGAAGAAAIYAGTRQLVLKSAGPA